MISFNNRCSFPDLTSFGTHFLDAADQKTVWVNLIEEILLQYNLNDDKKRKQQFNCALKFIIHYQNSETATLSIRKITSLAKQLFHLYNSLTLDPLSIIEQPKMALVQRKLAIALTAVERERFQLSLANLKSLSKSTQGADRYLSQTAFFSYLHSHTGLKIVQELSKKMNDKEKIAFNQSIEHFKALYKNYSAITSFIQAVNISISTAKEPQSAVFWNNVEGQLFNLIEEQIKNHPDVLIPMGWSFPQDKIGHHLLFFVENGNKRSPAIIRVFDTNVSPAESIQFQERKSPIHISSPQFSGKPQLEPLPFIPKKCSQKYQTLKLSEKICSLAKILMLQIPSFTQNYLNNYTCSDSPIDPDFYTAIFSQIISTPLVNTVSLEDTTSPLTNWNWFPAPSCGFASFQPLLQILALKSAELNEMNLDETEETNLKYFFEILQYSHKLFLLNNFFVGMESDLKELKEALHQSIAECENKLILESERLSPKID